ncbi:MAG: amidohydrolase family protein [Clostridia bacterium]|nr:amidohydrolase family protein [Clostridia bacterium]
MEIIDFHTHPFSCTREIINAYAYAVEPQADTVTYELGRAGIDRFCGSVLRPSEGGAFEVLHECNLTALKLQKLYKGRYIPGFHVSPLHVDASVKEIHLARDNGIRLIGEIVPYMHGWDYSCEAFSALLEEIEPTGMAVNLHTLDLDQMRRIALEHKRISFVFAHPGERDRIDRHVAIMKELDNVYLDISGTGILRFGMLSHLVQQVGHERILFGTDYPATNPNLYVACVQSEHINDAQRESIYSLNAKRLLGLD